MWLSLTNKTAESSRQGCRKHTESYKRRKDAYILYGGGGEGRGRGEGGEGGRRAGVSCTSVQVHKTAGATGTLTPPHTHT